MKVRMLRSMSGLRDGVRWPARGDVVVVPDVEGAELCANGYAEPVAEPEAPEVAKAEAPESRPARRGAAGKRG